MGGSWRHSRNSGHDMRDYDYGHIQDILGDNMNLIKKYVARGGK